MLLLVVLLSLSAVCQIVESDKAFGSGILEGIDTSESEGIDSSESTNFKMVNTLELSFLKRFELMEERLTKMEVYTKWLEEKLLMEQLTKERKCMKADRQLALMAKELAMKVRREKIMEIRLRTLFKRLDIQQTELDTLKKTVEQRETVLEEDDASEMDEMSALATDRHNVTDGDGEVEWRTGREVVRRSYSRIGEPVMS